MMQRLRRNRAFYLTLLASAALVTMSYFPPSAIRAGSAGAAILPSVGKPLVNLKTPQTAKVTYTGAADAVAALQGGTAAAAALASADFNADGAPDVVAGYSTKNGGVLVLHKGNPDAFAPTDLSFYGKAAKGNLPPTFVSQATAYSLPVSPDLLATGDFNSDGKPDVLVASRGGSLYFLAGDGRGNLSAAQPVALADQVMALAVHIDGHVAVATDGRNGPQVTILVPTAAGLTAGQTFPLPARANSLAWGTLGGGIDVAVGAGSNLVMIYGVLTANPQTETVKLPYQAQALALGDYIWDHDGRSEISVLADDGSIHIWQHGKLNTAPLTAADRIARRKARTWNAKKKTTPQTPNPTALGAWTEAKKLPSAVSAPAGPVSASAFGTPLLASSPTPDLMVIDAGRSQLNIFDTSGKTASPSAGISFSGTPVAALALPVMIDGGRDIVALTSNQSAPMVIHSPSMLTLNVNTVADIDTGYCTSSNTSIPSPLSLREAVCIANNSAPDTTTINVPIGTYSLVGNTDAGTGEFELATNGPYTLSIIGEGTAANTTIQQTDGVDRIFEEDFPTAGGNPFTLQNLTLSFGNCTTGTDCEYGSGAILSGGFPNDPLTLTNVVISGNSTNQYNAGGVSFDAPNLTVTNTTFSGNHTTGAGGGLWFADYDPINETAVVIITNSTFTGNTSGYGVSGDQPGTEGGGLFLQLYEGYTTVTVTGSTFTGNNATGGAGGGGIYAELPPSFTVSNSRFHGNSAGGDGGSGMSIEVGAVGNIENNWWGCNGGPGATGCDTLYVEPGVGSQGNYSPVLTLSLTPTSSQVPTNGSTTLTAKITDGGSCPGYSSCYVPDGTSASFSGGSLGTTSPSSSTFSGGAATTTFNAGASTGSTTTSVTVDGQTVNAGITIGAPPMINSANNTTFTVGQFGTFTVTTTGSPTPSLSDGGATLPSGVMFVDNGNGTATLSGTPATAGTYPFTITAHNSFSPDATQSFTLNVSQAGTSINVNSVMPSSEAYGQDATVTITAVLSWTGTGTPPTSGNVSIGGNGPSGYSATSCGAPSANTITCTATYTPSGADAVGSYNETASFSGDSNYTGSSSSQMNNFSITQAGTTTSVVSNQNPSTVGQQVTFTATVSGDYGLIVRRTGTLLGGGTTKRSLPGLTRSSTQKGLAHAPVAVGPTGNVTWSDNTGCGTTSISGGSAQCVTTTLPQGTDTITAVYNGDSNHAGSTGTLSPAQQVNSAQTGTSISVMSVGPSSEVYGQDSQVTITAVLSWTGSGTPPTAGNVTIGGNGPSGNYSATSCGSPSGDTLTCMATYTPTAADTVGTYTETASFSGDSNYTGSSSSQMNNFSITQAGTTTSVVSNQNPSTVGQQVTFTATIDGQYGEVKGRTGSLPGGNVSVIKRGAQRGLTQKGQAHSPDAGIGGTVTWSANTGCAPTTVSGNPGTAQCVTTTLPQGTDTITATYGGDTNHSGSMGTLSPAQQVNAVQTGTSISVMSVGPSSEAYGQDTAVTITAVLSWTGSGTPPTAGNVTIGGNGPSGNYSATSCGAPSGDTLSCTATYTPTGADIVGTYTETASFSGDSNYTGSSSTQMNNFSITQAGTTTSVVSNQNPSTVGQLVTFTATIDPQYGLIVRRGGTLLSSGATKRSLIQRGQSHLPSPAGLTGMVTWSSNTGCAPTMVSGNPGTSQCMTTTLPQGTDTITATYGGDNNHSGGMGTLSGGQQVNAQTAPAVTLNPTSWNFGTLYLLQSKSKNITVTNTGNATLNITHVSLALGAGTPTGEFSFLNLCPSHLAAGSSCHITASFQANHVGSPTATLNISDNAAGSPQQVPLSATVINPLASYNPASLHFLSVQVGHSSTKDVTLTNTGTTALDITSVSVTGTNAHDFSENSSGCPASLAPHAQCTISVTFTPSAYGQRSASLKVVDNALLSPQYVPLSGDGSH